MCFLDKFNLMENESIKDYKLRLFRNKKEYGLTDKEIAYYINKETGNNYDESVYRKWFKPYQEGYEDGIKEIGKKYDDKYFSKEKIKYYDARNGLMNELRIEARKDENLEILLKEIKRKEKYEYFEKNNLIYSENDCMICLNDIHFGISINNKWNKYNSDIAKKRLEEYLDKIYQIKDLNKSENAFLFCNGDLISGNIHYKISIQNRENVVEQIIGVSEILSWFISELCNLFNKVTFAVVAGNHSRLNKKNMSPTYERLDDLIPWYIKARLENFKNLNVLFNDIDRTFNIVNIRGKNYVNIHGDYDGFNTIQKIIPMIDEDVYCFHFGHLHHNFQDFTNGYKIIMSGSLMGMDDYCVEKRIFSKPQQMICICNKDGIFCSYDIIFD